MTESAKDNYMDISLDQIIVEEQVRSAVDTEGEAFKVLVASIQAKGILQPVLAIPKNGQYLIVAGERRFLAARQLGMWTIPARILDGVASKGDIISVQLIENLIRQDLDPVDQAQACLDYYREKLGETNVDAVINNMVSYNRSPEKVTNEVSPIIGEIAKYLGKSINSIINGLTLLKLPDEIKKAVRDGAIGVTQGYILAANIEDNPGLMTIFNAILEKPVTNATLTNMLKAGKKVKKDLSGMKAKPFAKYYPNLRAMKTTIAKGQGRIAKAALEKLLADLRALCTIIEQQVQNPAPAGTSETQVDSQPTEPPAGVSSPE